MECGTCEHFSVAPDAPDGSGACDRFCHPMPASGRCAEHLARAGTVERAAAIRAVLKEWGLIAMRPIGDGGVLRLREEIAAC